jgi:3-oxoacyl-[acyl-carrier protein] reductase
MINNKTILITGSSSGLGSYIALYFANNEFNVVMTYSKSKQKIEKFKKKFPKENQPLILKCDVTKLKDVSNAIKLTLKHFGSIDILINNAGIHIDSPVSKMTSKIWKQVLETNLDGVFNFSKAVLLQMKKQNYGRIINISSFTALHGIAGASNYAASKAGILGFTKSFAREVAKNNITVNAIAPGYFDIGMFYDIKQEIRKIIKKNIPAQRLGNPEEICQLINILISSGYVTGQTFVTDGGYSS